jgi:hypothetical protein
MRTWKRVLPVGNRVAVLSRRYFFSTAVVAFATISAYAWSGFPYDNLCENSGPIDPNYLGSWTLQTCGSGKDIDVSVVENDPSFRYCLQVPEYVDVGGQVVSGYPRQSASRWRVDDTRPGENYQHIGLDQCWLLVV